jgi:glucose/arabinose dehydrogenase
VNRPAASVAATTLAATLVSAGATGAAARYPKPSVGAGLAAQLPRMHRAARPRLLQLARRLAQPTQVTAAPGEPRRLYVVQRTGRVRVLVNRKLTRQTFLDLRGRVTLYGEEGLLSIAFHPSYASNRLVYAAYNRKPDEAVTVVEYKSDGTKVDPASARLLVSVPHEDSPYHNGGQLAFGPDGMLYAGIGDGGYTQSGTRLVPDPHGNSQNLNVLLGKIFRLDVASPAPRPELVAYGLRNPWRFSFDTPTGRLVIGDVGWNEREEVDVVPAGSGLVNLGWSVYEGRRRRSSTVTLNHTGVLLWPALTYATGARGNCSIVGGFVYRGQTIRSLRGRYLYGDYCSGRIWSVRLAGATASGAKLLPFRVRGLTSFGQDGAGELYAVAIGGKLYRIVPARSR